MGAPCYALIDCNNFYASCERLFRPDLRERPVVVLSNNDGCIIARSPEAKALGIQMATPAFKVRDLLERERVAVFSSNYAFYADISSRVMQTIEHHWPDLEIYSIDEAFLDLGAHPGSESERLAFLHNLRATIRQWTGIDVSIGSGPTKTLAKLGNFLGKKHPDFRDAGVASLQDARLRAQLLPQIAIEEIWGVGRRLSQRLRQRGIQSAADLAGQDPAAIRARFSLTLARTVEELQGTICYGLEQDPAPSRQLVCSRSFGQRITRREQMREAVATYAARVSEKLREQQLHASQICVFARTSPFVDSQPSYSNAASTPTGFPTDDSRDIQRLSQQLLDAIWKDGYAYAKAGVMLSELSPAGNRQTPLFADEEDLEKSQRLMQAIDRINRGKHGRIQFAAQGIAGQQSWAMHRGHCSPAYTTSWDQLPRVR